MKEGCLDDFGYTKQKSHSNTLNPEKKLLKSIEEIFRSLYLLSNEMISLKDAIK